jgi:dolichol-phosphate mannosyltransferase
MQRISTTEVPADAGIFGLIDARVAREIVAMGESDRYLPGLRSWVGFRQTGIVVERLARYDLTPRVSLRGLWRLAKTAIFSFSSFPLTVFYLIGYSALVVFFALSGYAVFCKLFTTLAIPGWTSHVLCASFFGAMNALGISILGEYVTRIYDQVRNRPLYLVARSVNCLEHHARGAVGAVCNDAPEEDLLEEATALLATVQPTHGAPHALRVSDR